MALAICRECGASVSSSATSCHQCGIPDPVRPKKTSPITYLLLLIGGVLVISMCSGKRLDDNNGTASASGPANAMEANVIDEGLDPAEFSSQVLKEAPPVLTKLLNRCGAVAASHDLCESPIYQAVWQSFETSTGLVFRVDVKDIEPAHNNGAFVNIYTHVPGKEFDDSRLQQYYFTCRGQYTVVRSPQIFQDISPNSTIDLVATTVCGIADGKLRFAMHQQPTEPVQTLQYTPEDYCRGFTEEACVRIRAGVENSRRPTFCGSGFANSDSGLSDEQLRICFVREDSG